MARYVINSRSYLSAPPAVVALGRSAIDPRFAVVVVVVPLPAGGSDLGKAVLPTKVAAARRTWGGRVPNSGLGR